MCPTAATAVPRRCVGDGVPSLLNLHGSDSSAESVPRDWWTTEVREVEDCAEACSDHEGDEGALGG